MTAVIIVGVAVIAFAAGVIWVLWRSEPGDSGWSAEPDDNWLAHVKAIADEARIKGHVRELWLANAQAARAAWDRPARRQAPPRHADVELERLRAAYLQGQVAEARIAVAGARAREARRVTDPVPPWPGEFDTAWFPAIAAGERS